MVWLDRRWFFAATKIIKKLAAEDSRLSLRLGTKFTGMRIDDNGAIAAVELESAAGEGAADVVRTGNVVLATGGFTSDTSAGSILAQYRPDLVHLNTTNGAFA